MAEEDNGPRPTSPYIHTYIHTYIIYVHKFVPRMLSYVLQTKKLERLKVGTPHPYIYTYNIRVLPISPIHLHFLLVEFEGLVEGFAGFKYFREQEVQQTKGFVQIVLYWGARQNDLETSAKLCAHTVHTGMHVR